MAVISMEGINLPYSF